MKPSPTKLTDYKKRSQPEYIAAATVEEFVFQTNISDQQVLNRVLLPGRAFGPYEILGFVAAGGMGEIYAATRENKDGQRSRPIALKVINPEHTGDWRILERFKREAEISRAIRSPNVIRVYEYGEAEGDKPYLAMELLRGEEFFERLCRVRTLPLDTLTDLALQILRGLSDIHRSGFIHRDIKPENVFLAQQPDGKEVAKILDFGIAKRRDERSDPLLSVVGQIYGTPEYLAPEQANHPDVDLRADLYSVGIMLYEAATGSLPFSGDTTYSVIAAHQNQPIPPMPSSVDPVFAEIVYRAMAKFPNDRFQSAEEMAQVLEHWRDETSWVEEVPGEAALDFNDVFNTHDIAPSTHVYLAESADFGDAEAELPVLEKLSVTKARERRDLRQKHRRAAQRVVAQTTPAPKPVAAPLSAASPKLAAAPLSAPAIAQDLAIASADAKMVSRGARIARIVTWLAVAIIVAAVALAFFI